MRRLVLAALVLIIAGFGLAIWADGRETPRLVLGLLPLLLPFAPLLFAGLPYELPEKIARGFLVAAALVVLAIWGLGQALTHWNPKTNHSLAVWVEGNLRLHKLVPDGHDAVLRADIFGCGAILMWRCMRLHVSDQIFDNPQVDDFFRDSRYLERCSSALVGCTCHSIELVGPSGSRVLTR